MHDVRLTPTERKVYESTDIRLPGSPGDILAAAALGLSIDSWRVHRRNVRVKLGIVVTERAAKGSITHFQRWERDPFADETPREARERVQRDLEEGRRCRARMLSGAPCSLLLPCASHQRG
jgi:hypothetical protein